MIAPDTWEGLLVPAHREKPRFLALTRAVLSQALDLLSLAEPASGGYDPETAVGPQLDTLGALCGVKRPGPAVSDGDYRALLRARIAAHHWDGTNETLPRALAAAFPGREVTMDDRQDGTVAYTLSGDPLPFPAEDMFPLPAGIRLIR